MAAAKRSIETVFLNEFVQTYVDDIAWTPEAMADLEICRVGLADVLQVLERGTVVVTEKEDRDSGRWSVDGRTCDDVGLNIRLQVWCTEYRLRVLRVYKLDGA